MRPPSDVTCWNDAARVQKLMQEKPRGRDDAEGFHIPKAHVKKAAQKAAADRTSRPTGRRTMVVIGTNTSCNVSGAPPPS